MGQVFNFEAFSRECSRSFLPVDFPVGVCFESLHDNCEEILDIYHPDRSDLLACAAGCGSCCILNVSVLIPEASNILAYLESQEVNVRSDLEQRLAQLWVRIRGVDDEERICMRQPCCFLSDAGSCMIYPVRPLLCRGVTSTDAEDCRQALHVSQDQEKSVVEMNLFQRDLYTSAYMGLSEGLEERGADGRGFEITGLLRYMLRNPEKRPDLESGFRLKWSDLA